MRQIRHWLQVFGVETGVGVYISKEFQSRSWCHFFGAGAGVKKVTPITPERKFST